MVGRNTRNLASRRTKLNKLFQSHLWLVCYSAGKLKDTTLNPDLSKAIIILYPGGNTDHFPAVSRL